MCIRSRTLRVEKRGIAPALDSANSLTITAYWKDIKAKSKRARERLKTVRE